MEPPKPILLPSKPPKWEAVWLTLSCLVSLLLLLVQIVRWPLVSLLTPFIEPLVEIGLWIALFVVLLPSLFVAIRHRKDLTRRTLGPALICLVTAVVVWFTPFDRIYLSADFHLLRTRRTAVARQVVAGQIGALVRAGGRGDLVSLPSVDHLLSDDGEVMVDRRDGKTFVLFFTFRGILDSFSGFVYSPTGDPPAKDEFLGDGIEIEALAPNWYWYSS